MEKEARDKRAREKEKEERVDLRMIDPGTLSVGSLPNNIIKINPASEEKMARVDHAKDSSALTTIQGTTRSAPTRNARRIQ